MGITCGCGSCRVSFHIRMRGCCQFTMFVVGHSIAMRRCMFWVRVAGVLVGFYGEFGIISYSG
ncbi:unnamed protein product, partial [Schistosoma haematobium]